MWIRYEIEFVVPRFKVSGNGQAKIMVLMDYELHLLSFYGAFGCWGFTADKIRNPLCSLNTP
jgi:hypothetical protein